MFINLYYNLSNSLTFFFLHQVVSFSSYDDNSAVAFEDILVRVALSVLCQQRFGCLQSRVQQDFLKQK